MEAWTALIQILDATIRVSVPLLLACLAGLYSERAGVFDIGLEGKMLAGAFVGAAAAATAASAAFPGAAWLGLCAAIMISVFLALVHGFASITNRGNQIVSGVAINFIAAGSTIILGQAWFRQGGRTPALSADHRFNAIEIGTLRSYVDSFTLAFPGFPAGAAGESSFVWLARGIWVVVAYPFQLLFGTLGYLLAWVLLGVDAVVQYIPFVSDVFRELILGHSLLAYFAFTMVPFTWWVLYRTRFGLRLRAVGENPGAVDTAGISVPWLRYRAVICTGLLTGVAGTYLAVSQNAGFVKDMTAGKGFIALAALIFAKWKPVPAMFACLLFGFLEALSIRYQGLAWPGIGRVPVQFINALPFILTVILLAGFIGKAIPPRAGGVPYVKER
ncbi:MAG: ABC transporter permease [Rhizobiaceae bacterium]|nr:ABC transporter permease [Rhizobiaceae bacterium]